MKKKQKIYLIVGIVVLVLVGLGVGGYFYNQKVKKDASTASNDTAKNESKSVSTEKTNNSSQTAEPIQVKPSTTTTSTPTVLGTLTDVSVTVYPYSDSEVASDGTTVMPAGSLVPNFFPQSGNFTIQKMVDGTWKDIITNYSYPGHGGITAWFAGPTEDNISYRVLQIDGGKPTSTSKTFVIKRSDLNSGPHTYN